jgi:hypothetical protein
MLLTVRHGQPRPTGKSQIVILKILKSVTKAASN